MKKIFVILLSVVWLMSLAVPPVAAAGAFDESPAGKPAPELGEGVEGVVLMPYGNVDQLPEEQRRIFRDAYDSIAHPTADLTAVLTAIAEDTDISADDLAVSDFFFLREADTATSAGDASITVLTNATVRKLTIISENSDKFVALLRYDNGKWSIVENTKLTGDNEIEFETDRLGAFAVVVRTDGTKSPADKGCASIVSLGAVALLIPLGAVAILCKKKKN